MLKKLFVLIFLFGPQLVSAQSSGDTVYLTIKQTKLRKEPNFLSNSITDIKFGEALKVISKTSEWIKVQTNSGLSGHVHLSSITSRKVILNSNSKYKPSGNSSDDSIVLAGKGFNKELENKYASSKTNVNYAGVDQMEQIKISSSELNQFVAQGKLNNN